MGVGYWYASRPSISEEAAIDDVEEPATALRMSARKISRHVTEEVQH